MASATEFLEAGQEGFEKKDSSGVEKYITDDFEMVTPSTTLTTRADGKSLLALIDSPDVDSECPDLYESQPTLDSNNNREKVVSNTDRDSILMKTYGDMILISRDSVSKPITLVPCIE